MKYYINLFPEKEKDAVDRVMYFAFHYLRYILVITQFVVICVFFFRFKVDQEIVDLKDGLQQKQQIIEATKGLLGEVVYLEKKTEQVSDIVAKQDRFNDLYNYFINSLPPEIVLQNVSIDHEKISCSGYSLDAAIIQGYEAKLIAEGIFGSVELTGLRKSETGFSFSMVLTKFKESNGG
ncbi:MAG: hypothetical protein N2691_01255 [Patescibacteria group bacterium]|nr:hypothetical protein [Patescibacteria group bacterium]